MFFEWLYMHCTFYFGYHMFIVSIWKYNWFLYVYRLSWNFAKVTDQFQEVFFRESLVFSVQSCHLKSGHFYFFVYNLCAFYFFFLPVALPILCWIRVIRADILNLFPVFGGKHSDLLACFLSVLAVPCGLQDLSSLTRDWTWDLAVKALCPNHGPPGNSPFRLSMLAVEFSQILFQVEEVLLYFYFCEFLSWQSIVFLHWFSVAIVMIMWFFFFNLLIW